ncbi:hypothetical protein Dsin_000513 [Dipteronia sinensis]|uniref:hAT-like transposase RNase-H fold domain-containing protein n=1 Tax=Dipteronia sinensis TaxID=43782 RepID=A0AAE0B2H4_9ROSI|nr:hypothetical protein Dsin_000513 [Dipteronia sinensis]
MASGGEGSRNLNKGKGPLQDLLEHQGDDVSYNDRLYHEFLQSQFGSDLPRSPNPPLIISDEPDPNLYDLDSNENLSTPQPPSNEFVAGEEEKPMKSDLFKLHMKKIQLDDGMIQIKCNYCSKIYRTNKSFGYGTYWNHIRKNHPSELVKTSNQSQISRYGTPTNQLFHYTSEKNKEELAVMVAVEHLPFSFGEKVGFVNYCQNALNPAMQRVPRSTLTRTMFSIYKKQKNKLKSFFYQFEGRVSVCADIWTDNFGSHHYMGVTCHYMDNDWVMQKRIITFRVFDDSHTAQNIFRLLKIIFEEFHIQNKIFAIGFDNAASNTASIPMLQDLCNPYFGGKLFHQRCACHILNLCVQAGLQILSVYIKPIRDSINYIWRQNKLQKLWLKYCSQNGMRPIKFSRDISTRWNSTYKLLNESVVYKELLVSFITYNVPSISLQLKHWDICIKILELLRVFNDATNALSGIYYPTTHLFLIQSVNIAGAFSECELDVQLSECVAAMKKKWLQYYKEIPNIYLLASCFDPRFKLECLQDYLTHYYKSLDLEVDVLSYCNSIKALLYELYDEYLKIYGPSLNMPVSQHQPTSDSTGTSSTFKLKGLGDRLFSQRAKKLRTSSSSSSGSISELDRYLETSHEFLEDS